MPTINRMVGLAVGVMVTVSILAAGTKAEESTTEVTQMQLIPGVADYVAARWNEIDQIPPERKEQLNDLAQFISQRRASGAPVKLTFICTHNSRRSHLSQIWAAVAAVKFDIPQVETFSGGTESTAFNPRAVAALERAGLVIDSHNQTDNPRYRVTYSKTNEPLVCFSKVYSSPPNPQSDYCAIMTCSSADQSCPQVAGATKRIAIPYDDPKAADGTDQESDTYDERSAQICREMLYAFSQVQ